MSWKVLVVDDDKLVHLCFEDALKGQEFFGEPIEIFHAYSKASAQEMLSDSKDYAVIFLDMVMETPTAGLELINFIRDELLDRESRIIFGTSYTGSINESELIRDYDINYYYDKNKNDLKNSRELLNIISINLRNYRDIVSMKNTVLALEHITKMRDILKNHPHPNTLFKTLLDELICFMLFVSKSMKIEGIIFLNDKIVAATEKFKLLKGSSIANILPMLERDPKKFLMAPFEISQDQKGMIYIESEKELMDIERNVIKTYASSMSTTIEASVYASQVNTQQIILINKLIEVIEARSGETSQHTQRVAEISTILGEILKVEDIDKLKIAASLHDIGKIGIPDNILNKPGKLTPEEFSIMKEHSVIGFNILKDNAIDILSLSASVSLQHHERWDGQGYPLGLEKELIDINAQIVSVADVFEALTHDRVYRPAWPTEKAVEYIISSSGTQFCPEVVDAFKKGLKDITGINYSIEDILEQ